MHGTETNIKQGLTGLKSTCFLHTAEISQAQTWQLHQTYTAAGNLMQQQNMLSLCIKLEANCHRMPSMHLLCRCRRAQSAVDLPLGCNHLTLSQAAALRAGSGPGPEVSLVMSLAVATLPNSLLST